MDVPAPGGQEGPASAGSGFGGSGFRVFRVQGSGCDFRVLSLRSRIQGLGSGVAFFGG